MSALEDTQPLPLCPRAKKRLSTFTEFVTVKELRGIDWLEETLTYILEIATPAWIFGTDAVVLTNAENMTANQRVNDSLSRLR